MSPGDGVGRMSTAYWRARGISASCRLELWWPIKAFNPGTMWIEETGIVAT